MSQTWFWNYQGKAQGPVTTKDMHTLIREGKLLKHYLVFQEGGLKWQEAGLWPELSGFFVERESLLSPGISEQAGLQPAGSSSSPAHWVLLLREDRSDGVFFRQKGPFTVAEVKQMLQHGLVKLDDHAWTQGQSRWTRLSDLDTFANGNFKIGSQHLSDPAAIMKFEPVINSLPPPDFPVKPRSTSDSPIKPVATNPEVANLAPALVASRASASAPASAATPASPRGAMPPSGVAANSPPPLPKQAPPSIPKSPFPAINPETNKFSSQPVAQPVLPSVPPETDEMGELETQIFTPDSSPVSPGVAPPGTPARESIQKINPRDFQLNEPERLAPQGLQTPQAPPVHQFHKPLPAHHSPEESLEDTAISEIPIQKMPDEDFSSRQRLKRKSRFVPYSVLSLSLALVLAWSFRKEIVPLMTSKYPKGETATLEEIKQDLPPPSMPGPANLPVTPPGSAAGLQPERAPTEVPPTEAGVPAASPQEVLPVQAEKALVQVSIPIKNPSYNLSYDPQMQVLEVIGGFKKGESYKLLFYGPPGQVLGLPSLYLTFEEVVMVDGRITVSLAERKVPQGNYRFLLTGKQAILDEKIALTEDTNVLRGKLARHRKLTAYSQQQERKKVIESIRKFNSVLAKSQKASSRSDKVALKKQLESLANKELQAVQASRYELFFPDAWQTLAQAHKSVRQLAEDNSARTPASAKNQIEKSAKAIKGLEAKVKSTTQYR